METRKQNGGFLLSSEVIPRYINLLSLTETHSVGYGNLIVSKKERLQRYTIRKSMLNIDLF